MGNRPPKELQDEWYAKLANDGFDDIEQDEDHLKRWTVHRVNRLLYPEMRNETYRGAQNPRSSAQRIAEKEEYYRLAGFFLHDYDFKDELERLIWEMHSEGMSSRETSHKLKQNGIKVASTQVRELLSALRKEMVKRYAK
jgi:hypothetical protein